MITPLLIGTALLTFTALGFLIAGPIGGLGGLIVAAALLGAALAFANRFMISLNHAVPLLDTRAERFLAHLSYQANIPLPALYRIPTPIVNAAFSGLTQDNAQIFLTDGALNLEDDELEAAIAHQVAHIRNGDLPGYTLTAILGSIVSYPAQYGYFSRRFWKEEGKKRYLMILAPLAAFFVRAALDERREERADWTAAIFTKKPEALASLLRIIAKQKPSYGYAATAHAWTVSPFPRDTFNTLFSEFPPTQKRIERLEVMAHL